MKKEDLIKVLFTDLYAVLVSDPDKAVVHACALADIHEEAGGDRTHWRALITVLKSTKLNERAIVKAMRLAAPTLLPAMLDEEYPGASETIPGYCACCGSLDWLEYHYNLLADTDYDEDVDDDSKMPQAWICEVCDQKMDDARRQML